MNVSKFKFVKATVFKLGGKQYRFDSLIDSFWNCTEIKTGAYHRFEVQEILRGYEDGSLEVDSTSILSTTPTHATGMLTMEAFDLLPEKEQEKMKSHRQFLELLCKDFGERPSDKAIQYYLEKYWTAENGYTLPRPSFYTIKRWLKKYIACGHSILALKDMTHLRGNKTLRIDRKLTDLCHRALDDIYLTQERGTLKSALSIANTLVREENKLRTLGQQLPLPTKNTLRSLLKQMGIEDTYTARYGYQAAREKFRNSVGAVLAERPLDRYEIDHTQLDMMVVDELTGIPIDRPWLTVVIDIHTRMIAGFHLSIEPPSCCALAAALKHTFSPKTYIKRLYPEIQNEWNVFGIPISLVVDNGMEFHARSLAHALMSIGVNLTFMPRKTPWFKAAIERAIGELNRKISGLSAGGRTFHSIEEKGDYDPTKTAVMTLKAVEKCITIWIVDVYHQSLHRTLKCTPQQRWNTHFDIEQVNLLANASVLDAITGNLAERQVWHYGIGLNNIRYNSSEFSAVKNQLRLKDHQKVTVRWNSEDVGKITVLLPHGAHIEVPASRTYGNLSGISLKQYKMACQDLVNRQLTLTDTEALDAAITHIRNFAKETAENTKQVKSKLRREERQAAKDAKLEMALLKHAASTQQKSASIYENTPKKKLVPECELSDYTPRSLSAIVSQPGA